MISHQFVLWRGSLYLAAYLRLRWHRSRYGLDAHQCKHLLWWFPKVHVHYHSDVVESPRGGSPTWLLPVIFGNIRQLAEAVHQAGKIATPVAGGRTIHISGYMFSGTIYTDRTDLPSGFEKREIRCRDSNKASFYLVRHLCFMFVIFCNQFTHNYTLQVRRTVTPFSLRSHRYRTMNFGRIESRLGRMWYISVPASYRWTL